MIFINKTTFGYEISHTNSENTIAKASSIGEASRFIAALYIKEGLEIPGSC